MNVSKKKLGLLGLVLAVIIGLAVAVTGGSAVAKALIGPNDIKVEAIHTKHIKDEAVTKDKLSRPVAKELSEAKFANDLQAQQIGKMWSEIQRLKEKVAALEAKAGQ